MTPPATPTGQTALAMVALLIMGAIALAMVFTAVPPPNHDYMLIMLGALAGALTVTGGQKLADKLTTSTGPGANIQADAAADPHPQA